MASLGDATELHAILIGGSLDDTIEGGDGADADTFVFTPDHGTDTITDFADGEDLIDLSALAGIAGFADLEIETYGTATLIDLTCRGGGLVWLEGTLASDLDVADFVFCEPPTEVQPIDGL